MIEIWLNRTKAFELLHRRLFFFYGLEAYKPPPNCKAVPEEMRMHCERGSHPPHVNIGSGKFLFLVFTGREANQHNQS